MTFLGVRAVGHLLKVKRLSMARNGKPSQSYGASHAIWDHTLLPLDSDPTGSQILNLLTISPTSSPSHNQATHVHVSVEVFFIRLTALVRQMSRRSHHTRDS